MGTVLGKKELSTGRYYIVSKGGRRFCIEPIHERNDNVDSPSWLNGGISGDEVKVEKKLGGSVREKDSIITPENGFKNIVTLPPGHSPNGFVEAILACETVEEENALWEQYSK